MGTGAQEAVTPLYPKLFASHHHFPTSIAVHFLFSSQKYISKFGGDPSRVTLIGADEGSMAVSTHLVAFDGEHKDLFNSAVLLGGVALPMPRMFNHQLREKKSSIAYQLLSLFQLLRAVKRFMIR